MHFTLWQLFAIGLLYLSTLFLIAHAAEKGWIPGAIVNHRFTHVLSLGVFACAISIFGSVHLAYDLGGGFLLYFIAASAPFLVAPLLMGPLRRITQAHRLSSLADVFAFRFPGRLTGGIVAVSLLLGALPLIALQVQAVVVTTHLLNQELSDTLLAALFCAMITVFAVSFGTRHIALREQNKGLVMAIATESAVKLVVVGIIAAYALDTVLDEVDSLDIWLASQAPARARVDALLSDGQSRSLLLIFFAAAVALPHTFHMAFSETSDPDVLATARWGFPLYLLLLSLAIPPILWAGLLLDAPTAPEYFGLGIGIARNDTLLMVLGVVAALSATSGVLILLTSALASMTLNHVVLPFLPPSTSAIYARLLGMRRAVIATIILAGFALYSVLAESQSLVSLGLVSFIAVAQFLPGLAAALLWQRATREGFIAGLCAGMLIWFVTLLVPLVLSIFANLQTSTGGHGYELSETIYHATIELSLAANTLMMIVVSLLTRPSVEEQDAAYLCMTESAWIARERELEASSVHEIRQSLAMALGRSLSDREVDLAIADLRIDLDDQRPHALRRLRDRMEHSISGILGQTIARNIVRAFLPLKETPGEPPAQNPQAVEARIEEYQLQLTGLAKELDGLRRYHRQTLQELPTAVCSISADGEVLTWNDAMAELTGLPAARIIGQPISVVEEPWHRLLTDFAAGDATHLLKSMVQIGERTIWLNLHKALVEESVSQRDNFVIVVEDITENQLLESQLLHSERLASIGQLAASVAHEIGNPVTGIACLTQNLQLESVSEEVLEVSEQILDQTERISSILQSLVNFAHSGHTPASERMPVRLKKVVDDAIQLLRLNPRNQDVSFINRCSADLFAVGDAQRLGQVFVNVLSNARDASREGDSVLVQSREAPGQAVIEVIDKGHGIPASDIADVFEPFFTTKEAGQGTGLGLTIVYSIIEEHNGTIEVESPVERDADNLPVGTRFTIALPLFEPAEEEETAAAADEGLVPNPISVKSSTPKRYQG